VVEVAEREGGKRMPRLRTAVRGVNAVIRRRYTINNEAKVRQSTRSLVIGTAKVIRWEDLENARAERVAKDKAAAERGQGKRGRKRKVSVEEADSSVKGEGEGDVDAQRAGL
jgi:hypothetical protein